MCIQVAPDHTQNTLHLISALLTATNVLKQFQSK